MDKLTRSQRRGLANRTHAHYDTNRERTFLFCEPFTGPDLVRGCNLIWDVRERSS